MILLTVNKRLQKSGVGKRTLTVLKKSLSNQ